MDTLIGKLTDLAYEFFGVILPGFFFLLFLTIWWLAVGEMFANRTGAFVPALHLTQIGWIENTFSRTRRIEVGLLLLVLCYFFGQLLNWGSRPRTSRKDARWFEYLLFRFSRPEEPFNPRLKPLFEETSKRLAFREGAFSWPQFYPVAKSLVARNLNYSLIQTYQHKYTLHRCVTLVAVILFWLCALSTIAGLALRGAVAPNWFALLVLAGSALWMVWGFSRSYTYFWGLWGDTIVTESYTLVCVPKVANGSGTKK